MIQDQQNKAKPFITEILSIDPREPDIRKIKRAADILRSGGVVAFPTETVYGLGANAFDVSAIRRIFDVKGRPQDNPLIVHIAKSEDLAVLVEHMPGNARALMDAFWPGPLTLVLKKSDIVPYSVTGGLENVAVRMPSGSVALALILELGVPIAAPSANLSGRPSPTTAEHVLCDLDGKINAVLDGGTSDIGIESSVLDLSGEVPTLLRPGGITKEQIEDVIGIIEIHPSVYDGFTKNDSQRPASPGMKYRHYAPNAQVILLFKDADLQKEIDSYRLNGKRVGVMLFRKIMCDADAHEYLGENPKDIAQRLFGAMRSLDAQGVDVIISDTVPDTGIGLAIMNKLRKASHHS